MMDNFSGDSIPMEIYYPSDPGELDLVPDHIRDFKNQRICGDEEEIAEAFFELRHKSEDLDLPICGKRKIMLVKGEEGSRKSFFVTCVESSAFIDFPRYTLGFNFALGPDECIVHFDTEMDAHEIKARKMAFNKMCKLDPRDDRHQVFSILDYTWKQRLEFISHAIMHLDKKPAMIVIDQVADLLPSYDVNNTEHAGSIIENLLGWIRSTGAMILVTMHTNRGGISTNGILGKNLDHKVFSSFLIQYDKDDHITRASHFKSRKRKVEKIKFMQDDFGLPRLLNFKDDF